MKGSVDFAVITFREDEFERAMGICGPDLASRPRKRDRRGSRGVLAGQRHEELRRDENSWVPKVGPLLDQVERVLHGRPTS